MNLFIWFPDICVFCQHLKVGFYPWAGWRVCFWLVQWKRQYRRGQNLAPVIRHETRRIVISASTQQGGRIGSMGTGTLCLSSGSHWAEMGKCQEKLIGVGFVSSDPEWSWLSRFETGGPAAQTHVQIHISQSLRQCVCYICKQTNNSFQRFGPFCYYCSSRRKKDEPHKQCILLPLHPWYVG